MNCPIAGIAPSEPSPVVTIGTTRHKAASVSDSLHETF